MPSGSSMIGDVRDRTAFAASFHKTVTSFHAQTAQSDAFADLFRLIANASPSPDPASPRSGQIRSEKEKGSEKDDELQNAERSSPPAFEGLHAARRRMEDLAQGESLVGLTRSVQAGEKKIAAETGSVAEPATAEEEGGSLDGLLSEAEIVAAGQHQTIVTAGSPDGEPIVTETMAEAAQLPDEEALAKQSTVEIVDVKPQSIEVPAAATKEGGVQPAGGENTPTEGKPVSLRGMSVETTENSSVDPAFPKPPPNTLDSDSNESVEVSIAGREDEGIEEPETPGKPIFGDRDAGSSDSRRYRNDRQVSPTPIDANRVPLAPSQADGDGRQAGRVSTETGIDATAANQAVADRSQTVDLQQANANSVPPPTVSAAAALGSAASDAASPKTSAKSTPAVGVASAPAGTTENAPRPAPSGSNSPGVADRIRLVQRVANAFQRLGVDGGQVRIRLHPADLGSVRLDMQIEGKRLNARVTTETEAARGVLREHLSDLRQRLVEQGIQVERIDVELETETQGNRDSSHQEGLADRFDPSRRRGGRAAVLDSEGEANPAAREDVESRRAPVERSVAEAAARPGVDLVF